LLPVMRLSYQHTKVSQQQFFLKNQWFTEANEVNKGEPKKLAFFVTFVTELPPKGWTGAEVI
jgi:hypothetical protein